MSFPVFPNFFPSFLFLPLPTLLHLIDNDHWSADADRSHAARSTGFTSEVTGRYLTCIALIHSLHQRKVKLISLTSVCQCMGRRIDNGGELLNMPPPPS
jgi:hypothetical protein